MQTQLIHNPKLYNAGKPVISWVPWVKKWVCRMYHKKYDRIITGHGKKPETAYNAYKRKLKWYVQGQPGLRK